MSQHSIGGRRAQALAADVYASETVCCRCDRPVDHSLPWDHPMGHSVDHYPVPARYLSPDERYNRKRVRLAHRRCNNRANSDAAEARGGARTDTRQPRELKATSCDQCLSAVRHLHGDRAYTGVVPSLDGQGRSVEW